MNEIDLELSEEQIEVILEALNDLLYAYDSETIKHRLISQTIKHLETKLEGEPSDYLNACIGCGEGIYGNICRECSGV